MPTKLILIIVAIVVLVLALLLLGVVVYLAYRRAVGHPAPAAPNPAWQKTMMELLAPTQAAFELLIQRLPRLRARYEYPLVVLTGEDGCGKSTLLQHSGLHGEAAQPQPSESAQPSQPSQQPVSGPVNFFHFDQGTVLEVGSAYLALQGTSAPLWRALARHLQRYRPRRPLDGLVLCLSADSLDDTGALEQRAAQLQRRLSELQRQTGLRLPVYLLLTCADRLPGFASLAASVPPTLRNAMLGWSNPYDLEAQFAPDWAAEACTGIADSVTALQAELLAADVPLSDADSFFLLPGAIDRLRAPLSMLLKRLMGPGTETESPCLRGVYLCGNDGAGGTAFVRDLLAGKLFAEAGLARPLRNQVFSRDRRAERWRWATAALVLIWGGGLVHAYYDLDQRSNQLLVTVKLIDQHSQERDRVHKEGRHLPFDWYRDYSISLVHAMAKSDRTLRTLAVPQSWHLVIFSELDDRIDVRFREGLHDIVLPAIDKGLNLKAIQLAGLSADPVTTMIDATRGCQAAPVRNSVYPPQMQVTDVGEFVELTRYVDEAARFGRMTETFTTLQKSGQGRLSDFQQLGEYTGLFTLSPEEVRSRNYLSRAVQAYDASLGALGDRERYRSGLRCGFEARSEAWYAHVMDNSELLHLSRAIAENIGAGGSQAQAPAVRDTDSFQQLGQQLHRINEWLKAPASAWLHADQPELGKPYLDLRLRVANIDLLGADVADDFGKRASRGLEALHDNLLEQSADLGGVQVVERNGDGSKLQLTPELAHLESQLGTLRQQAFMEQPPASLLRAVPDNQPVMWNLNRLNQTMVLVGDQHNYLAQELGNFPRLFQRQVKALADRRLGANLIAGAAAAAEPGHEGAELYVRLGQSEKLLIAMLDAMQGLEMKAAAGSLAGTLAEHASAGLGWIDQRLDDSHLYLPRDGDFNWWNGSRNPAAQGYTDGDPQGLDDYLGQQHTHLENGVKLAQPLLRLEAAAVAAGAPHPDTALVQRWKGIAGELERFNTKQPGSRIAALDAYLRGELSELDQNNCLDKHGPAVNLRGADYFAQRANLLVSKLNARCGELGRTGANAAYASLAAQFRRTLAYRFPFAPLNDNHMAAEPEDVAAFLQLWDRSGAEAQRLLSRGLDGGMAQRQRDFLASSAQVRGFLAPLLPPADGAPAPGYDLKVLFRVNERGEADNFNALHGEVDGNKIVDWKLQVGDQVVGMQNGSKAEVHNLSWRYGMPIVLTLRWADNLLSVPYDDSASPYMSVSGHEVRYAYSEPWSLMRLLAAHRSGNGMSRYETLRFEFPTQAPGQAKPGRGRVFVRMSLSPANQKDTLAVPVFPVDAPGAATTTTAMARP